MNNEYKNECIKKVENFLSKLPIECSNNFYNNIKTVSIIKEGKNYTTLDAVYDEDTNEIKLYNKLGLVHELIHMASSNQKKVNTPLFENNKDFVYSDGLAFKTKYNDHYLYSGNGLTEGFTEYITYLINKDDKDSFLLYMTKLLLNIKGNEDLINYYFNNDILGFFSDKRCSNLVDLRDALDDYLDARNSMSLMYECHSLFDRIDNLDDKKKVIDYTNDVKYKYKTSIINALKIIYNEYQKIKEESIFITTEINKILTDKKYSYYFAFDNDKLSVRNKLTELVLSSKIKKLDI